MRAPVVLCEMRARQVRGLRPAFVLARRFYLVMRVSREAAAAWSTTMSSTVFVRDRREAEIELRETLRVEKSIDLDDLPVRDGEGDH
jgi:hypothetical protein